MVLGGYTNGLRMELLSWLWGLGDDYHVLGLGLRCKRNRLEMPKPEGLTVFELQ